jgi:hypothetical protein
MDMKTIKLQSLLPQGDKSAGRPICTTSGCPKGDTQEVCHKRQDEGIYKYCDLSLFNPLTPTLSLREREFVGQQ